jgi:hypothetical protein
VGDVLLSMWKIPEDLGLALPCRSTIHLGRGFDRGQSSCFPHLFRLFHISANILIAMAEDTVTAEAAVAKQSSLRCVASTGDRYRCTVDDAHPGWADQVHGFATRADKDESNCFRHALLSADGTAVVTYNEDLILRTFAV